MKSSAASYFKSVLIVFAFVTLIAPLAYSANLTLQWDANVPAPEGYRVFARQEGQNYDYNHPIWEDNATTCTLIGLVDGVTYFFVVRAFEGNLESADSQEVAYTPAVVVPNQAPSADAGTNQTVYEGATVTLDGSNSSDADGSIIGFQWSQTAGNGISLTGAATAQASFTAPVVGINGENFNFSLTVTDDAGSTSTASVMVSVLKSSSTDVDGDLVPDVLDVFPNDPSEWADNDSDGIGDNQDADDDNDGMSDSWELTYGLDPLTDDAQLDADGDGISNVDEYQADSDPTAAPGNNSPDAPVIEEVVQVERVSLTPVLVTAVYFDSDNDDHLKSQWQISTEPNFVTLILDELSESQLTAYQVGEMVLDVDTTYYWRVKFIDERSGASEWSQTASFTTLSAENSDDTDINGIPDAQEVDDTADVDEDGIPDCLEGDIMSVITVEGSTMIGVETVSDDVTLVSIKSIATDTIPDQSVQLGFGLIGFKLYLHNGVTTATVKIHFDKRVPKNAKIYKYLSDTGWEVFPNAVFAPNRKSVTLMLEDGGAGDEDGVANGVIVDPAGIAYTESDSASLSTTTGDSASASGGGGCFISASSSDTDTLTCRLSGIGLLVLIALGVGLPITTALKRTRF
jgi:hypothetical protein